MMKSNIVRIFPKCYYLKDNVCASQLCDFETFIKNLKHKTSRSPNFNVNSSHSFESNLHKIELFNPLTDEIMRSVKDYMISYGYNPSRISEAFIQTMWFNISGKGDYLFPHSHPGSFLSGAFYIKTTSENHLFFHDENKNYYEDPVNINDLSTTINPVQCKPGRLIIFSSDLQHSTPVQMQDGEKIIISFNVVLENKKR